MTRQKLIAAIQWCEAQCRIIPFLAVVEVRELASGVLAVLESYGERTIYFDQSRHRADHHHFSDRSGDITEFPPGVGFIECGFSGTWWEIRHIAKEALKSNSRRKTRWHRAPFPVRYR